MHSLESKNEINKRFEKLENQNRLFMNRIGIFINTDTPTISQRISKNKQELSELKEKQNHWATLENVTVCRLGIESLEEILREGYTCLHNYFLAKKIPYYVTRFKQMLDKLGGENSVPKLEIVSLEKPSMDVKENPVDSLQNLNPSSKALIKCKLCGNEWDLKSLERCPTCFPDKNPSEQDVAGSARQTELMDEPSHDIGLNHIPDWMGKPKEVAEPEFKLVEDWERIWYLSVGYNPKDYVIVEKANLEEGFKALMVGLSYWGETGRQRFNMSIIEEFVKKLKKYLEEKSIDI